MINWFKTKKELIKEIDNLRKDFLALVRDSDSIDFWAKYYNRRNKELENEIYRLRNNPADIYKEYEEKINSMNQRNAELSERYEKLQEDYWKLQDTKSTPSERKLLQAMQAIKEVLNETKE